MILMNNNKGGRIRGIIKSRRRARTDISSHR
jgi:hypothetical protein